MTHFRLTALSYSLLCLLCSLSAIHSAKAAAAIPTVEYQIKASLVFNFIHFVTWPENTREETNQQINVCLIGNDLYGSALQALAGESVHNKVIVIHKFEEPPATNWENNCHVAIFTGQEQQKTERHLSTVADKAMLTIGESAKFLQQGGIIRFTIIDDTVNFEINQHSAQQAHLNISSKLLRLADKVLIE